MKTTELKVGKFYTVEGSTRAMEVVAINTNRHGELGARFSDGTHFRYALDFDMFTEAEAPKAPEAAAVANTYEAFTPSAEYLALIQKKAELYRQGKNTTMRVAYINQQLEALRAQR